MTLPNTVRVAEADDIALLTVHLYSPAVFPVRVWVYSAVVCAVVVSNTVSVPSVTLTESLVQVTVVAGPPVEIQVRMNSSSEIKPNVTSSNNIVICPNKMRNMQLWSCSVYTLLC